jgi:hypothetical protein
MRREGVQKLALAIGNFERFGSLIENLARIEPAHNCISLSWLCYSVVVGPRTQQSRYFKAACTGPSQPERFLRIS